MGVVVAVDGGGAIGGALVVVVAGVLLVCCWCASLPHPNMPLHPNSLFSSGTQTTGNTPQSSQQHPLPTTTSPEQVRSGSVDIVVVDSVSALTPRSEVEGDIGTPQV